MRNSVLVQRRSILVAAALVAALAALIASHEASATRAAAQIKVAKTALGRIVVDPRGRTLYMFAADKHGKSVCYGTCATFWPPLLSASRHVVGSGIKATLLGTTKRKDGKLQVTLAGRPLYLFVKDTKAGQTRGQGLNEVGGLWWVMSPSGAIVKKTATTGGTSTATTPTTTTTPGYGYGY